MPSFPKHYEISAPAWHAARTILEHFHLTPKSQCKIQATEKNLAIVVDVCTQIFKVEYALDHVVRNLPSWNDKQGLTRSMGELQDALRMLEFVRNYLPRTEKPDGDRFVLSEHQAEIEHTITQEQRQHNAKISEKLNHARTATDQLNVMRQAGLVR